MTPDISSGHPVKAVEFTPKLPSAGTQRRLSHQASTPNLMGFTSSSQTAITGDRKSGKEIMWDRSQALRPNITSNVISHL